MRLCLWLVCTYVSVCARIAVRAYVNFVSNVFFLNWLPQFIMHYHNALLI